MLKEMGQSHNIRCWLLSRQTEILLKSTLLSRKKYNRKTFSADVFWQGRRKNRKGSSVAMATPQRRRTCHWDADCGHALLCYIVTCLVGIVLWMYDLLQVFHHQIIWQWELWLPCATFITDMVMVGFLFLQTLNLPTKSPKIGIWILDIIISSVKHPETSDFCILIVYMRVYVYIFVEFIFLSSAELQKICTPLQVLSLEKEIFRDCMKNQFRK